MAILLDSFHNGARGPWRYWHRRCGHLVSDTSIEELHEFASALGLRRMAPSSLSSVTIWHQYHIWY